MAIGLSGRGLQVKESQLIMLCLLTEKASASELRIMKASRHNEISEQGFSAVRQSNPNSTFQVRSPKIVRAGGLAGSRFTADSARQPGASCAT